MASELPFGRMVRARRRALDLTQEELANRVGCAAITVRKIEAGDMRPSQLVATRLAVVLEVPEEEQAEFVRAARLVGRQGGRESPSPTPTPTAPGVEAALGEVLSRSYRLGEQIGGGSFGIVYRAIQPRLDRNVAIKVIRPQYADHPDFIRRFEAEAQMVARLEHPHIVPLYDYWREPGVAYLVMRYIRGGSLLSALERGPPALPVTLRIVEQIGAALQASHRAGVIHRDLKPANLLLDEDGNAYLADFGIAKDIAHPEAALSFAGAFVGSPAYSSPEQIRAEPVTPQTDIYALGVLLYELLTGHRPFRGPSSADYIQQHLNAAMPALAEQRPGLPPGLDQAIQRATAKLSAARYAEVGELVADVRAALAPTPELTATAAELQPAAPTLALDLGAQDNPYKGLQPFGETDASTFFGRESLVQRLLDRMAEGGELARFLAIVGPSGSGKSSVVRAGLLPALRRGALPGSERWYIVDMMPGAEPLAELAAALRRVAPAGVEAGDLLALLRADSRGLLRAARLALANAPAAELVLVIDQFEELFTLCTDEAARAQLFENLIVATLDERSRLRLLITIRADFADRPLHYVDFGELFSQRSEPVLPMTADELERAVVGPARWAGLALEEGLAAAIVAEIGSQPGALPLLQHALSELYARREGRVLTRAAYAAIGGVSGALTRSAEALYTSLDLRERETARRLLLALVSPGEGAEDTRRRVRQAELRRAGAGDDVERILERFGRARLLSFDRDPLTREPTVEVAHEALLRAWPRLKQWVDSGRERLTMQRRLGAAAAEWIAAERDASFLASGVRLAQFEALGTSDELWLNDEERAYLEASLAARARQEELDRERQQRELRLARRGVSRLRWLVGGLIVVLLAALGLAALAYQQQQAAQASALVAQGQALASAAQAAIAEGNLDQARALALAAVQVPRPAPEAEAILAQAAYAPGTRRLFRADGNVVMSVAFGPDGATVLAGSADKILRVWDARSGAERQQLLGLEANPWSVAYSRDGRLALAASPNGLVHLWDVASGVELRRFSGHSDEATNVAFSPDGRSAVSASRDKTLRMWDLETGQELRRFTGHDDWVWGLAFSADGRYLLSGSSDNTLRLWDAASGVELRRFSGHDNRVHAVDLSPDGRLALSGSWDETARLWDLESGEELRRFTGHNGVVSSVAFGPDGSLVATSSANVVHIWDAASGEELYRFDEHRDEVFDLAFSPDGRTVLSGSRDGTLRLWDLVNGAERQRLEGHTSWIRGVALGPDGRTALSGAWDWTLRVWDLASGQTLHELKGHEDGVEGVALSPDGTRALSAAADATLRLWDVRSGEELRRFDGHESYVWDVAFSPDGSLGLSGGDDGTLRLWQLDSGEELRRFEGHLGGIESVAFSPDGRRILSGSADSTLRLWDTATASELRRLEGHSGTVTSVALSPDGALALSGSVDGTARLWDVERGADLHRFPSQAGPVLFVAFSPDGRQALFTSSLSSLALWDVASGRELRRFDTGGALVYSAAFSADGTTILAGTTDTTLRLWRIDPLPELLAFVREQRYLPELSCAQRERYQLLPLCDADTQAAR
jgi:WD40 repeat protein/transcriptional regulator with XRE-family HTH domain